MFLRRHTGATLWLRLKEFLGSRLARPVARPGLPVHDPAHAIVAPARARASGSAAASGNPVEPMRGTLARPPAAGRARGDDGATEESEAAAIAARAIAKAAASARLEAIRYPASGFRRVAETFSVGVVNMCDFPGDHCMTFVDGFASAAAAVEYARRRTRDSVEELRRSGQSRDELARAWSTFGESCFAHRGSAAQAFYAAHEDLAWFIDHPASPHERNWTAIDPRTKSDSKQ